MSRFMKPDTKNLGQYKLITPETNPDMFRDPALKALTIAEASAATQKLFQWAVTGEAPVEELEDDDGNYERGDDPAATAVPADALDIRDGPWKTDDAKSQPLTYAVPTDVQGGKAYRTIKFQVDFKDAKSVENANKRRRQGIMRESKKLGLPLKRPSTVGREYTQANAAWIMAKYDSYATANNGRRITMHHLAIQYNLHFPNEYRSQPSLASHIHKVDQLRAKKNQYPQ